MGMNYTVYGEFRLWWNKKSERDSVPLLLTITHFFPTQSYLTAPYSILQLNFGTVKRPSFVFVRELRKIYLTDLQLIRQRKGQIIFTVWSPRHFVLIQPFPMWSSGAEQLISIYCKIYSMESHKVVLHTKICQKH